MNKDLYLDKDYRQALLEHLCIEDCHRRIGELIKKNDLHGAELLAFDLLKSIRELKKLQEKKIHRDQLEAVVKKLSAQGVLVELVVRKL